MFRSIKGWTKKPIAATELSQKGLHIVKKGNGIYFYYVGDSKVPPKAEEKMEQLTNDIYKAMMSEEDKAKIARWQTELEESFKKEIENKGGK